MFLSPLVLDVEHQAGALVTPLIYQWRDHYIIAPIGFVTDGASIPRWLPRIYATFGGHAPKAAAIHDYLYFRLKHGCNRFTRHQADWIFLEAMQDEGVDRFRRAAMYIAVRLFGGVHLCLTR